MAVNVAWRAQPGPQRALLACPVFETLFGGARGGGKTDGMLGEWAGHAQAHGEHAIGIMFRRSLVQLQEAMERAKQIYGPVGATWLEQKKEFIFPNGARLKFRYLDNDNDATNYQGHNYTRVYFEELTNFPSPDPVMKMMATLRSSAGVPCRFRATANPGGPGHSWVKARYIDPAPGGWKVIRDPETGLERVFIPSKLQDNAALMASDGDGYVGRLKMSGSAELVRAWLEGDWSVIAGAFFDEWANERHVLRPFSIPRDWMAFRSADWGSAKPFAVYWLAVVPDDYAVQGRVLPRGALVVFREWYGCPDGKQNVGLKLTAEQVADGILAREKGDTIKYGVLDPAAFAEDGGPSLAERMHRRGVKWRPADNARVGRNGAMGGWDQVRARLAGDGDGRPLLYVFDTCAHLIRTVPTIQHDAKRAEDLDTEAEDHAADALRYGCMSRPRPLKPAPTAPSRNPQLAGNAFRPRSAQTESRI